MIFSFKFKGKYQITCQDKVADSFIVEILFDFFHKIEEKSGY